MKSYILIAILSFMSLALFSQKSKVYEHYYNKFSPTDSTLQVEWKDGSVKKYKELNYQEKKQVNSILKEEYGVTGREEINNNTSSNRGNYVTRSAGTVGRSLLYVGSTVLVLFTYNFFAQKLK